MRKIIFSLAMIMLLISNADAQKDTSWHHKKCAVVLTYDDALNVDLTNAIPALDSLGLKATFYLSDYFGGLNAQLEQWRKAAAHGHELGNHTIYHPCLGNLPGRTFVTPDYDLNHYTVRRITDEIRTMNVILKAIDGKSKRTFAFPCSDTKIHDTAYINGLKNEFVAARAVRSEMLSIGNAKLYDLPCYMINGESGAQLIDLVKEAMKKNALLIFLFHGVGGEHSLNVSLAAHSALLHFLKLHEKEIWIAPMIEVAEYIKAYQTGNENKN